MFHDVLNQLIENSKSSTNSSNSPVSTLGEGMGKLGSALPGGLASGAAAGGIMALLIGNKKARKLAGKAAGYGGAAALGGLAYSAYKNWQQKDVTEHHQGNFQPSQHDMIAPPEKQTPIGEITLIKAMIAAAKADGHLDPEEQARIFEAVARMDLSAESKGRIFDLLSRDISVPELAEAAWNLEQKSEIYLASCLVIEIDHPEERRYLDSLAEELDLPEGLPAQLESQATHAITVSTM